MLDIHVRSEGCDDPGKAPGTCGIAYIKVNGVDHSLHRRGHNVVIVDAKTGTINFFHISLKFPLKSDFNRPYNAPIMVGVQGAQRKPI